MNLKNTLPRRATFFLALTLISASFALSVQAQSKWKSSLHDQHSFVRNKGQFDDRALAADGSVEYAVDLGSTLIMFTPQGVVYRFDEKAKNHYRKRGEKTQPRMLLNTERIRMTWDGANANVRPKGDSPLGHHHIYSMLDGNKRTYTTDRLPSLGRLLYTNIYNGVDVEYTIHPEQGVKYAVHLAAGADVAQVRMKYDPKHRPTVDAEGNLRIATAYGDIIDHAPVSFYADSEAERIATRFVVDGNTVRFELEGRDPSRAVVIDPWVVTPLFQNSNRIWDIANDLNSSTYVYGGDSPMRLRKYDALGNLQWTYTTPWDSANYWIGTMTTDTVGNSYITTGTSARVRKIDADGNMVWESPLGQVFGPELEYWSLTFNCDQTQLMCGGMRANSGININSYRGAMIELSLTDGSILGHQNVGWLSLPRIKEVRSICYSPNGRYYYLTLDSIGSIDQGLNVQYQVGSGYDFSYGIPNYGVTNQGTNIIAATTEFIYTHNGSRLHKRYITDGNIISSVSIPGGSTSVAFGETMNNAGLAVDSCGNVYVGSLTGVHKFDADLNLLGSATTPGAVYDVSVNRNGEVVACGAGFVASVDLESCHPPLIACRQCLEVSNAGPFCATDGTVNLNAVPSEGTWSGPGITDANAGTFDPSLAGTGFHTIHFIPDTPLSCGSDSIVIVVSECGQPEVCVDSVGNFNVFNGTFPYQWQRLENVLDCSGCPFGQCIPIICPGVPTVVWSTYANGPSAAPHGTWPIRVIDAAGNAIVIEETDETVPCDQACRLEVEVIEATQLCVGETDASATAVATGNIGNVTYSWNTNPEQTGPTATALAAGTYIVTAIDGFGCTDADTVAIVQFPEVVAFAGNDTLICLGDTIMLTATGGISYLWETGDSIASISVAPEMTTSYGVWVTGEGDCTDSTAVLVMVDERICLGLFPNVISPGTQHEGGLEVCTMVHQNSAFHLPCLHYYPGNKVTIFDRWGRKRYEATDYHDNPWNGNGGTQGVYYWLLELPGQDKPHQGFFHILK